MLQPLSSPPPPPKKRSSVRWLLISIKHILWYWLIKLFMYSRFLIKHEEIINIHVKLWEAPLADFKMRAVLHFCACPWKFFLWNSLYNHFKKSKAALWNQYILFVFHFVPVLNPSTLKISILNVCGAFMSCWSLHLVLRIKQR